MRSNSDEKDARAATPWAEAWREAVKGVGVKINPGARRGFDNDTRGAHRPEAAADARRRTLKFFRGRPGE